MGAGRGSEHERSNEGLDSHTMSMYDHRCLKMLRTSESEVGRDGSVRVGHCEAP